MLAVKGILTSELRLSVPGEDRLNMTKLSSKECSMYFTVLSGSSTDLSESAEDDFFC